MAVESLSAQGMRRDRKTHVGTRAIRDAALRYPYSRYERDPFISTEFNRVSKEPKYIKSISSFHEFDMKIRGQR